LISAAILILPQFVFMPKLIQWDINVDIDAAIEEFAKNKLVKKLFWTLFEEMAGLLLARVVDPMTALQVVGMITK